MPISEPINHCSQGAGGSASRDVCHIECEGAEIPGEAEITAILGLGDWEIVGTINDQREKLGEKIT